ncbi:murein L,D-transpeptidase catalytic domain family protein [Arachidicoccus sp.]|uniref:murein L,D-transpeptidase catalytic domain family protein n=1 Tax=Arachidicoccus sp. TaxID=1872624 RepID=UPI003D1E0CB4
MKKFFFLCTISICTCAFTAPNSKVDALSTLPVDKSFPSLLPNKPIGKTMAYKLVDSIYNRINLDSYGLNKDVFFNAYKGYEYLMSKGMLEKTNLLTIVDYSQSSTKKRFYVIDLKSGRVLFNTYVSHGKRSGGEYATSFSNVENSHKSSLGFIITGSPYRGGSGYSLHLNGVENGINNHIRERSIVIHGSHYVNEKRADESEVGRSFGCPAVPFGQQYDIINTIKDGSCVFIWAPDNHYQMASRILNATFQWPALKIQKLDFPELLPNDNSLSTSNHKLQTKIPVISPSNQG